MVVELDELRATLRIVVNVHVDVMNKYSIVNRFVYLHIIFFFSVVVLIYITFDN